MKKPGAMSLLDEALEAWAYTREGVIAEVKNLPESALDFKPTDASRTTRALVEHILESGLMMAGELTRADGDFQRQSYPEFLAEYARDVTRHRTKAALVKALENTHADGAKRMLNSHGPRRCSGGRHFSRPESTL